MVMFGYFFRKDLAIFQGKGGRMTKSKILGEVKNTGGGRVEAIWTKSKQKQVLFLDGFPERSCLRLKETSLDIEAKLSRDV